MRSSVIAAVVLSITAGAASADITYLTSTRTVNTSALANGITAADSATATLPVFDAAFITTANYVGNHSGFTTIRGSQHSELLADRIIGSGHTSGTLSTGDGGLGAYSGQSSSHLDVTFHLDAATAFALLATADSSSFGVGPTTLFSLSGGSLISPLVLSGAGGTLNTSGTLGAGDYHIEAHALGNIATGAFRFQNFDFTLTVPAPAAGLPCVGALLLVRRRR